METRLICDGPADGVWNMAVDEALLETVGLAAATPASVLRFYQWSPATLSLGYFQGLTERQFHAASRDCPLVRRASGGGAILHDRELTYSFATAVAGGLGGHEALYDAFHDTLVETLADWGVRATRVPAARLQPDSGPAIRLVAISPQSPSAPTESPAMRLTADGTTYEGPSGRPRELPDGNETAFLCFERRSPGDVLVAGMKVGGSAQRRNRGALLQHGSVLLRRSPFAPELPGIAELTGVIIEPNDLRERWCERLATRLALRWRIDRLTDAERENADSLGCGKFGGEAWTNRRP
ncbi:MAG: biotin/lipoate A/B protein ligase family protein [Planctomycetota bacterium]